MNYPSYVNESGRNRLKLVTLLNELSNDSHSRLCLVKGKAIKLGMEKGKIVNVKLSDGTIFSCAEDSEVILCCGAFATPLIIYRTLRNFFDIHGQRLSASSSSSSSSGGIEKIPFDSTIEKDLQRLWMNLGNSFQDHFIVSHIYLGNWFTGWKTNTVLSSDTQQRTMLPYPLNGVHGWVWLDATGNYLQDNQKDQVKY
jgi:hypothetical protein